MIAVFQAEPYWVKSHRDGRRAGVLGIDPRANPRVGHTGAQEWLDGWIEGDAERKAKEIVE